MITSQNDSLAYSNRVSSPKYYLGTDQKKHRFNHLDDFLKKNFEFLLQYISPDTDLTKIPTLSDFISRGVKITVLNYTNAPFYLFKDVLFTTENFRVTVFKDDNSQIIAYDTFKHPGVTCIEMKNDYDVLPQQRFYSKLLPASFFKNHMQNDPIFNQLAFKIEDKFFMMAEGTRLLMDVIDKKALLKENIIPLQFLPRNGLPHFTLFNHTDKIIHIDIKRNLYIENNYIYKLPSDGASLLIIYQFIDHPELICIERLGQHQAYPDPRRFASLGYTHGRDIVETDKINVFPRIESQNSLEHSYLSKIKPPSYYKNEENLVKKFRKIDKILRRQIENLLNYISADANITSTPSFRSFHVREGYKKILNYTNERLTFSKNDRLCINKKNVKKYPKVNCLLIAYNINSILDVICVEKKFENKVFPSDRAFIVKTNQEYRYMDISWLSSYMQHKCLSSQIPRQIIMVDRFIQNYCSMSSLIQNVAKDAFLKDNPTLVQYKSRDSAPRFTILNYTNEKIEFDIQRKLLINNEIITDFLNDDCQIITYHREGHFDKIFIEQQDEASPLCGPRISANLAWKTCRDSSKYIQAMNQIYKELFYQYVWKGIYDEKSFFSEVGVPKDIVRYITSIYMALTTPPPITLNL